MYQPLASVNEFNLSQLHKLMSDWPEDRIDWQPHAGLHSARWILMHLAIAVDYGMMQLGLQGFCPNEWHSFYGPGSHAGSAELRPSVHEILEMIEKGYSQLRSHASELSVSPMTDHHQVGLLAGTPLVTKGDLAAHILASHFAFHLGQLSTLRRMLGKPPLF